MHSCLQIPEMVSAIIQWLYDDYRTLTALAVTCQIFRDPASALIWASLDSLAPLIRCLPAHLLEEKVEKAVAVAGSLDEWWGSQRTITKLYLKTTPAPADWERFDICAYRVRNLMHWPLRPNKPGEVIYPVLDLGIFYCLGAHKKCLPNLISLWWREADVDIVPQFGLFVGPHLANLLLDTTLGLPLDIFDPLSSLRDINSLHLYYHPAFGHRDPVNPLSLTGSVTQLRQIFSDVPFTAQTILHLSTSPSLARLLIPNDTAEIVRVLNNVGSTGAFANIQDLNLFTAWPASCAGLLKLLRPAFLKRCTVTLKLSDAAAGFGINSLYFALHDYCSHSQLEFIKVACAYATPVTYSFDDLKPLLCFTNLREIAIPEFSSFDIDSACLKIMAAAWPRLERFDVRTCAHDMHDSKVGLEGLRELVARCPALRFLRMELRISSTDICLWKEWWGDCRNDKIKELFLLESTFDCDAKELAMFLYSVFPNLVYVAKRPVCLGGTRDLFYEVNRHLRAYRGEPKGQGLEGVVL